MLLNTRPALPRHETTNAHAFVMCPAAQWAQQLQPAAPHSIYAYALEQAQRVVASDQFRRLQMFSAN